MHQHYTGELVSTEMQYQLQLAFDGLFLFVNNSFYYPKSLINTASSFVASQSFMRLHLDVILQPYSSLCFIVSARLYVGCK